MTNVYKNQTGAFPHLYSAQEVTNELHTLQKQQKQQQKHKKQCARCIKTQKNKFGLVNNHFDEQMTIAWPEKLSFKKDIFTRFKKTAFANFSIG